jgi:tryptophan synthase alpha chain
VPDLPPEEAGEFEQAAQEAGLVLIPFLSPTSNPERIANIAPRAQGFIYLVSVAGVTGARQQVQSDLGAFVARVRAHAQVPLAVGFGIGTPEQAAKVGALADGVIVGSALVNTADKAEFKAEAAGAFVASLQAGLKK